MSQEYGGIDLAVTRCEVTLGEVCRRGSWTAQNWCHRFGADDPAAGVGPHLYDSRCDLFTLRSQHPCRPHLKN